MTADGRLSLSDAQDLCHPLVVTPAGAVTKARPSGLRSAPEATRLTQTHRLAGTVKAGCDHGGTRTLIGGVGCGQCWEQAVRADALTAAAA